MQIIPVMDLRKGVVVHAIQGDRQNYKAINSRISLSAMPHDVIDGFLSIHGFKIIYIADLDALENRGTHKEVILSLCKRHPNLIVWLDCGTASIMHESPYTDIDNVRLIISSESIPSMSVFTALITRFSHQNLILSLDFKSDRLIGLNDLLHAQKSWPNEVIVLNLDEVGANNGFVYPTYLKQNRISENFKLYAGGGIRNLGDIHQLKNNGIKGALVSSALHSQAISSKELASLSQSL